MFGMHALATPMVRKASRDELFEAVLVRSFSLVMDTYLVA